MQHTRLGPFRILGTLARGGIGDVHVAVLRRRGDFSKLVAIKRLCTSLAKDPAFVSMFFEEACLGARLNHPNVVNVIDFRVAEGSTFVVMEHLDGQTLARVRRRLALDGGLPLAFELRALAEVLDGLHYAHELAGEPMLHLAVSPQNVLVTYDGRVKILDFGVANTETTACARHGGRLKGSVAYLAPEVVRGGAIDRRADVFAVGVMMWEAIARRPFWGAEAGAPDILRRLSSGDVPRAGDADASMPAELARICARAIAIEPRMRYPSAAAFAEDLDAFLALYADPTSAKAVGRAVARAFATEREQLRVALDPSAITQH
jgi:serine/threonine-protein kinase